MNEELSTEVDFIILGNKQEWCKYSLASVLGHENVRYFEYWPLSQSSKIYQTICRVHHSPKINKKISLPLKKKWYRVFDREMRIRQGAGRIIIIYDQNPMGLDFFYIDYIKEKHKDIFVVYVFTNIVELSVCGSSNARDLLRHYDGVYTFDMRDAEKYSFTYSPLVYCEDSKAPEAKESDVFYLGNAKDRLPDLISAFEVLQASGLKCDFNIVGVADQDQKYADLITYNKPMSYLEAISRIKSTKCLYDAIQQNSSGYTIKTCEAVIYDKYLITTNENVATAPFFRNDFIQIIDQAANINVDEAKEHMRSVSYMPSDKDYFSPEKFLDSIQRRFNLGE